MKTATLRKALLLAKPCLGPNDGPLPIMSHFCFMPDCVYAYNDVVATIVEVETGLACALHGETLAALLEVANVDELKVKIDAGKSVAQMDVGNGWIKVPSLPDKDFLFSLPEIEPVLKLRLTDEVRRALELCLMSVGTDSLKPEFAGVTVIFSKGQAVFFSTNNETASRYIATDKVMGRKDVSFVLPAAACEQILKLQGAIGEGTMVVGNGAVMITYNDKDGKLVATMVSKLVEATADFATVLARHLSAPASSTPPLLFMELKKAAVLLGRESSKRCTMSFDKGKITVRASGMLGSMDTDVAYPDKKVTGAVEVDPEIVLRVLPYTDHLAVNNGESLVFTGGGYTIVVAAEGGTSQAVPAAAA
jgi:hypothetical protein